MTFRRPKKDAREKRIWNQFLREQSNRLDRAGVPGALYRDRRAFEYFLMHGAVNEPIPFSVDGLNDDQAAELQEAIVAFLRELPNPGLSMFGLDVDQELVRLAQEDS